MGNPRFNKNMEDRCGPGDELFKTIREAYEAAFSPVPIKIETEERKDLPNYGPTWKVTVQGFQQVFTLLETTQRLWPPPKKGQTELEARAETAWQQVARMTRREVPVRIYGGDARLLYGSAKTVPPSENSQLMRDILSGLFDHHLVTWRNPSGRTILSWGLSDLRELTRLTTIHGVDRIFPPHTASYNPDGTVKRYFNPEDLDWHFGSRVKLAARMVRPAKGLIAMIDDDGV